MNGEFPQKKDRIMKKLVLTFIFLILTSYSLQAAEKTLITNGYCNGPKLLCWCPSAQALEKELKRVVRCQSDHVVSITNLKTNKNFSDGGDIIHCRQDVTYECVEETAVDFDY